jgi:hypothetical protein
MIPPSLEHLDGLMAAGLPVPGILRDWPVDVLESGVESAITGNHPAWLAFLLAQKGVTGMVEGRVDFPLVVAIRQSRPELVRCLLDNGVKPVVPGQNPLTLAIVLAGLSPGDPNPPLVIDLLLEAGVSLGGAGENIPPLCAAAATGNLSLACRLVAGGADMDASFEGKTLSEYLPFFAATLLQARMDEGLSMAKDTPRSGPRL